MIQSRFVRKTAFVLFFLSFSVPVLAMWGGSPYPGRPGPGCNASRGGDVCEQIQFLQQRVASLEMRMGNIEANFNVRMPVVEVWDCTLTNNFGDIFAVVSESELLGKAAVMHECRVKAKVKLDCGEEHVKCIQRKTHSFNN